LSFYSQKHSAAVSRWLKSSRVAGSRSYEELRQKKVKDYEELKAWAICPRHWKSS
jgi:hypothetical protein